MKKKDTLNKREEELMNYLWEIKKPLTASEMAKQLESEGWTNITLCRTVQSLSDNGYLEVAGLEKTAKTYARRLIPSLTKEESYKQRHKRKLSGRSYCCIDWRKQKKQGRKRCRSDCQAGRSHCVHQG